MCIVLLATAHPAYSLIVIDNRDEFILRPTSRPHWWSPPGHCHGNTAAPQILSARDLQRSERGTWLGITKSGKLAVLTNYREADTHDANNPVSGLRSRGGMVTAWLGSPGEETTEQFVDRMLQDGSVKGVGGFSLICGKLRPQAGGEGGPERTLQPMAIISNRSDDMSQIPWIVGQKGQVYGLSNTVYEDPASWPKVQSGQQMLRDVIQESVDKGLGEQALVDRLFAILDRDTLPTSPNWGFEQHFNALSQSIFVPPFGDERGRAAMREAAAKGKADEASDAVTEQLKAEGRPDPSETGFMTGLYGTQRQTIILADWDGNVAYIERALWDGNGNPIERGHGDTTIRFKVDGWNESSEHSSEDVM